MLKILMLKRSLDKKNEELEALRAKDEEFSTRESELEQAIAEAKTQEEETAVTEEVEKYDAEKQATRTPRQLFPKRLRALKTTLPP